MRRLIALTAGLPPTAATAPAWTLEHELAARQIETTAKWLRVLAITLGQKPSRLPDADVVEHPERGAKTKPKLTTDPAAIAAWFRRKGG